MIEDQQITDIGWHRNMHSTLCYRADMSTELLELHVMYLKLTEAKSYEKDLLKAFQTKLQGTIEPATLLEKNMDPWQLYETGHPAWTRDFNPVNIRLIQQAQEFIDSNEIEKDIDVKPMLLSGNDLTTIHAHYARIYDTVDGKETQS